MDLKAIGSRIKAARETRQLTQEQLAEKAGLSTTHISVIERGVKGPSLETFVNLANALDVTADSLLLDVLNNALEITATELSEQIRHLPPKERTKIFKAVRILVEDTD